MTSADLLSCRKRTESPTLKRAGRWVCVRVRKSWGGLITWRSCPPPTIKPQRSLPNTDLRVLGERANNGFEPVKRRCSKTQSKSLFNLQESRKLDTKIHHEKKLSPPHTYWHCSKAFAPQLTFHIGAIKYLFVFAVHNM